MLKKGLGISQEQIEFWGECSHTRFACYSAEFSKPTKFDFRE